MLWVFANVYRTFCTTDGYMTLLDVATILISQKKEKKIEQTEKI